MHLYVEQRQFFVHDYGFTGGALLLHFKDVNFGMAQMLRALPAPSCHSDLFTTFSNFGQIFM